MTQFRCLPNAFDRVLAHQSTAVMPRQLCLPAKFHGALARSFTNDVDPVTCLTANGLVRIAACSSPEKGMGAFAAQPLAPGLEIGRYSGEVLTLGEMITRYGGGGDTDSPFEFDAANEQAQWVAERAARGVGVTGTYLFNAGVCPISRKTVLVDAEDPQVANFTRYINHSVHKANLIVTYEVLPTAEDGPGEPLIRFLTDRQIMVGEELLFDYGDGFDIDVMDFVDD